MSYADIAAMVEDWPLRMRLIACAAQEQDDAPAAFVETNIWRICAQPQWDAAWASALVSHGDDEDYSPGADAGVISDPMILSGTQKVLNDLQVVAVANAQFAEELTVAQQAAEDDREFNRQTRMRQWELEHLPQYVTPPPIVEES